MSKINLAAPAGMTGIGVDPWGEVFAVAANWAEASSPVMVYGKKGWDLDGHGRQVADFRHSDQAALESVLREVILDGGDEPDDDQIAAILDDAVELSRED